MSDAVLFVLIVAPVALAGLRLFTPLLPLGPPRAFSRFDLFLFITGLVALVFHCVVMFFPAVVGGLASTPPADAVLAFGLASKLMYAVPAAMVLVALRRIPVIALAVTALALTAVGVTMYNGTAINVHVATIVVADIAIAASATAFAKLPARRQTAPVEAA